MAVDQRRLQHLGGVGGMAPLPFPPPWIRPWASAIHRRCMFHGRCTGPSAIAPSPSGHSSVHWRRNCSADHTATQTIGHSTIDITALL